MKKIWCKIWVRIIPTSAIFLFGRFFFNEKQVSTYDHFFNLHKTLLAPLPYSAVCKPLCTIITSMPLLPPLGQSFGHQHCDWPVGQSVTSWYREFCSFFDDTSTGTVKSTNTGKNWPWWSRKKVLVPIPEKRTGTGNNWSRKNILYISLLR